MVKYFKISPMNGFYKIYKKGGGSKRIVLTIKLFLRLYIFSMVSNHHLFLAWESLQPRIESKRKGK